jgi:hypothetical protein
MRPPSPGRHDGRSAIRGLPGRDQQEVVAAAAGLSELPRSLKRVCMPSEQCAAAIDLGPVREWQAASCCADSADEGDIVWLGRSLLAASRGTSARVVWRRRSRPLARPTGERFARVDARSGSEEARRREEPGLPDERSRRAWAGPSVCEGDNGKVAGRAGTRLLPPESRVGAAGSRREPPGLVILAFISTRGAGAVGVLNPPRGWKRAVRLAFGEWGSA